MIGAELLFYDFFRRDEKVGRKAAYSITGFGGVKVQIELELELDRAKKADQQKKSPS